MPPAFERFAAIDWSGAKGSRHRGIAVAICTLGQGAPIIVTPSASCWSRQDVARWLIDAAREQPTLFGFDFSFAPPFITRGAYFPGVDTAHDGPSFWSYVDRICDDDDLGAASFANLRHRDHFYFGKADGQKAGFMHARQCEMAHRATGGVKPSSIFDVVGAAQVAKASFAGMRLLNQVHRHVPIWPFDDAPITGSAIIEIYTSIAARAGGIGNGRSKIRDRSSLDLCLGAFGTDAFAGAMPDDHQADAIVTAAWMRHVADNRTLWQPAGLTRDIAQTEGWTFGII